MEALLFFLFAGAFVLFGFRIVRKITQRLTQRRAEAREVAGQRGWVADEHVPDRLLYRIHGRTGDIAWEVVAAGLRCVVPSGRPRLLGFPVAT